MRICDWSSDVCSSDLLKATAVSTDRLAFPHCGIVGVGGEGVVMTVRKTTISGDVHFAQDRLGVETLDAKTFLSGVIFPLARPADTVRIDQGQLFLELRTMMQVVKLGNRLPIDQKRDSRGNMVVVREQYGRRQK